MAKLASSRLLLGCSLIGLMASAGAAMAQDAPIIQPGAPGQAARALTAVEAARIADNRYSADDVKFMQDMILHHWQAVQMSALVKDRTNTPAVVSAASRIDASQGDEIDFMRGWLRERGQTAPDPANDPHAMHASHGGGHAGHAAMAGMATPEQMAALEASSGATFDKVFLELMIAHHEGALTMANNLLRRSGSAYDPMLFRFVNDVNNEQQGEIDRMTAILRGLSTDPRTSLKPGFRDAGEAISNLTLIAALPKPTGFYDQSNPAGLPPPVPAENGEESDDVGQRGPFLSFANTDMAFSGNIMAVGNYHGFNLYRLDGDAEPKLVSSVVCPGGQGDVSIVGDLLIMSVESNTGRIDCGRQGVEPGAQPDRFRGIRIFNISNPIQPVQVGQVQTCRGSHTHSVVWADERAIIVYNSGTAGVRDEKELAGCVSGGPGEDDTALFSIDVIEIPVADPSRARIIDSPRVFSDPATGQVAGLWPGGDHGDGTQDTARTDQCHDITVFPSKNLAAGACSGNGVIFDITDPRKPVRIDQVVDPGFAYWHSATFNNDGTKVLFTDEWGGGGRPRCRVQDPMTWGADAFYDIVDNELVARGHFKLPAAQTDLENCVAHNGSIVPVPGRDIFVQSWYQGGLSLIDFTDSSKPVEIGYFDRGPLNDEHMMLAGYWSSYWYDGRIYATEIVRGLDVFELKASDTLSENEIAAARLANQGEVFNPQQQFPVNWPDSPVVSLAYVDQLERADALPAATIADLRAALEQAKAGGDAALAGHLDTLAGGLTASGDQAKRITALKASLTGVAATLR